jgi:hypothetical protein
MSRTQNQAVHPVNSLGANNMTGTAVVLGAVIDMLTVDKGSFEIQAVGTGTGALTLEGSNQYDAVNNPNAVFIALAAAAVTPTLTAPAGANVATLNALDRQALGARFIRVRYVNASGTGKLDVYFSGQGVS